MLVYAIRHGQSHANKLKFFPGIEGNPLTEKGFDDARHTGELLKEIRFDRIYSSDLLRAVQTAQAAIPNCEPILDPRLRETFYGDLAHKDQNRCLETMGEVFKHCRENRDYRPYGGECQHDHATRVGQFMHDLENLKIDSTIAVFCHEGTIKSMLSNVMGFEIEFRKLKTENGCICVFEYDGDIWKLSKWGIV